VIEMLHTSLKPGAMQTFGLAEAEACQQSVFKAQSISCVAIRLKPAILITDVNFISLNTVFKTIKSYVKNGKYIKSVGMVHSMIQCFQRCRVVVTYDMIIFRTMFELISVSTLLFAAFCSVFDAEQRRRAVF
jgi:hypothetical protein